MRACIFVFGAAIALTSCGPSSPKKNNHGPDGGDLTCAAGQTHCNGKTLQTCVDGTFEDSQECPDACAEGIGCTLCQPGTGTCSGNTSTYCDATGQGYETETCDPLQGSTCNPSTGVCDGPCAPHNIGQSYIGCEYYPTVSGNPVSNSYSFAVAVANTRRPRRPSRSTAARCRRRPPSRCPPSA